MKQVTVVAMICGLLAVTAGCASGPQATPTAAAARPVAELDGLVARHMKGLDEVYVRPGTTFRGYQTVQLDRLQVEFDKDWDPNRETRDLTRMISPANIEKLKDDMAREFRAVFAEELQHAGFQVVEQADPAALRLSPALTNVYVNAPDLPMQGGRSRTYTRNAGKMTLHLDARDPSGQLLARVVDEYVDRDNLEFEITNSVTNAADFRRAVRDWAKRLRSGLKVNDVRAG